MKLPVKCNKWQKELSSKMSENIMRLGFKIYERATTEIQFQCK